MRLGSTSLYVGGKYISSDPSDGASSECANINEGDRRHKANIVVLNSFIIDYRFRLILVAKLVQNVVITFVFTNKKIYKYGLYYIDI